MTFRLPRAAKRTHAVSLATLVSVLAALALPTSAAAFSVGVESNGEFVNSNVTREGQVRAFDKAVGMGAKVVRVNAGWNEAASACGDQPLEQLSVDTNPCYNWTVLDGLVEEASLRGVQVLMSVSRAPVWLHNSNDPYFVGTSEAQHLRFVEHFTAFMTAAATRYGASSPLGEVRMWTVWNEPNSKTFWKPSNIATPRRYAQLYARVAVAIKNVNPRVLVAPGPTGPLSTIKPVTFITLVQKALPAFLPGTGAAERKYVNAWAHNPYPGLTSPWIGRTRSPGIGMSNIRDLVKTLDRSPLTRGTKIWATEFGYQTPPERMFDVSFALQGQYMAEAFDWLDSTKRVTIAIWYGMTDPRAIPDFQSGTYTSAGRAKPSLLWARRPISVRASSARRGSLVRVWARSNVKPRSTRIMYSLNGRTYKLLPLRGRRSDGVTVQMVKLNRTMWFATWDGTRGPARKVVAR